MRGTKISSPPIRVTYPMFPAAGVVLAPPRRIHGHETLDRPRSGVGGCSRRSGSRRPGRGHSDRNVRNQRQRAFPFTRARSRRDHDSTPGRSPSAAPTSTFTGVGGWTSRTARFRRSTSALAATFSFTLADRARPRTPLSLNAAGRAVCTDAITWRRARGRSWRTSPGANRSGRLAAGRAIRVRRHGRRVVEHVRRDRQLRSQRLHALDVPG